MSIIVGNVVARPRAADTRSYDNSLLLWETRIHRRECVVADVHAEDPHRRGTPLGISTSARPLAVRVGASVG